LDPGLLKIRLKREPIEAVLMAVGAKAMVVIVGIRRYLIHLKSLPQPSLYQGFAD